MTTIGSRSRAVLIALHVLAMGAFPAPAPAMQILDAADHAELAAEISATGVNRVALAGDRIAKVVRAPDGFAVEHDAGSGDLYLRPVPGSGARPGFGPGAGAGRAGTHPAEAGVRGPVTLFIGTEKGFTYRLTLVPAERDSAQILIRNAAVAEAGAAAGPAPGGPRLGSREGRPHIAALVRLVRAVARREPLPGYEIHADRHSLSGFGVIETWRGPRFRAFVLEAGTLPAASADGAAWPPGSASGSGSLRSGQAGLAGTIADALDTGRLAALWLAAPGTGPSGGRLAVAVMEATGEPR